MAYTPQQWHDDTTDSPYGPISGDRLNYIESGIQAAAAAADAAGTAAGGTATPLGTAAPIINGVAAAGTSGSAAHEDHVHPTDTSRAALASPTFTGHPVGVTEAALNNSTRLATTAYTDTAVGVETTRASTAEALLAPLASPTLTGSPSLPTGTTGVTQSAADSTTKLATTAFVTTADNLKANLASPTFTGTATIPNIAGPTTLAGTVTLPSTTVAVTPSASDNSTKPATTAYVDTADALKANLAAPTFTGAVVLPTGTTGVTQTAADNSTKLATTAYTDTGLALKANLASPTFTGTPTLPTGTILTTQTLLDNSTKAASTAYVDTTANATVGSGAGACFGPHNYANIHPSGMGNNQTAVANANDCRYSRIIMAETGHLRDLSVYIATLGTGNGHLLVLDTGQANATHTTCTCLAISGNLSQTATGWITYDPNLAVTKGDTLYVAWQSPDTTAKAASPAGIVAAAFSVMPTNFLASSGAGTTAQKLSGHILAANVPNAVNGTVTDANMLSSLTGVICFIWRIS